mmetsp:Transcript_66297/g.215741  ORF Transcript_66297/g.215741 Transcript_66297/m.215741 type:complete len:265 (-) Transcript_66297:337-1131(-)
MGKNEAVVLATISRFQLGIVHNQKGDVRRRRRAARRVNALEPERRPFATVVQPMLDARLRVAGVARRRPSQRLAVATLLAPSLAAIFSLLPLSAFPLPVTFFSSLVVWSSSGTFPPRRRAPSSWVRWVSGRWRAIATTWRRRPIPIAWRRLSICRRWGIGPIMSTVTRGMGVTRRALARWCVPRWRRVARGAATARRRRVSAMLCRRIVGAGRRIARRGRVAPTWWRVAGVRWVAWGRLPVVRIMVPRPIMIVAKRPRWRISSR